MQEKMEKRRELLVCTLAAVSHHSLFPVSYRWRAASDYKDCHPSGPPAHPRDTSRKRKERAQLFRIHQRCLTGRRLKPPHSGGQGEGAFTHRSPQGHTIFWGVAEVVGFKRVPEGEDDGSVVSPLEVHLHVCVMEANPELLKICQEEHQDKRSSVV